MKLFEVDLGAARSVLSILQGMADEHGESAKIPWPRIKNILKRLDIVGITDVNAKDGLEALKRQEDPEGDVIKDIDDQGNITLNTKVQGMTEPGQTTGPVSTPTIDKMASSNAKNI
jgi:hypothetical protein